MCTQRVIGTSREEKRGAAKKGLPVGIHANRDARRHPLLPDRHGSFTGRRANQA